ncbi:MAG TPA: RbsD/FucU family protein [Candidatus Lokiarchaeia archaeon]|nr:RbsD/FucU family protein [Candidatus Lokiarchaeia archaeon]
MLKTKLLHPEILRALGSAGHGSKVLIADGNYPFTTGSPVTATKVFLNLMPGIPKVTDVLEALASAIPIEAADVMVPDSYARPDIFAEFEALLEGVPLTEHSRFEFYDVVRSPETTLVIATAEQRRYANLLLTIGVVKLPDDNL